MKTITIVTDQVSDAALTAALPAEGVASVTISPQNSKPREVGPAGVHRAFGAFPGSRFNPVYRVDLVVDDDAVDAVFDGISFAYGAGLFSDAEAWVSGPALALSA